MSQHVSRRTFVKSIGVAGVGYWAATSALAKAPSPNEKLNIAVVGLGRQGADDISDMLKENIIAAADVDHGYMLKKAGKHLAKFPEVKLFEDFRVMFDKLEKQIDAVVVATPDHLHFHPAWSAMQRGKHLYQEKPLAHNVWEVRQLTNLAREKKLATQLGVQRHDHVGLRDGVELIKQGTVGTVKEVYSWAGTKRGGNWTKITEPSTDKLNWDLWLGPTEAVPHRDGLAHYDFRFWWKYGTGETGNWGCHVLDIPFWALDLKYPTKVSTVATGEKPDPDRTPLEVGTIYEFPANDKRPGVTLHWYQNRPAKWDEIIKEYGLNEKEIGTIKTMFIGDKGILICGFDSKSNCWLLKDKKATQIKPEKITLAKPIGFRKEWLDACKGSTTVPTCNFEYSGPLTETVLLGNAAFRSQTSFNWNAEKLTADNPAVSQYLKEVYRKGWEV